MKVRELIEALQVLDPDLPVFSRDVSYGWCDIDSVKAQRINPLTGTVAKGADDGTPAVVLD